jgi:hypothetical protein
MFLKVLDGLSQLVSAITWRMICPAEKEGEETPVFTLPTSGMVLLKL